MIEHRTPAAVPLADIRHVPGLQKVIDAAVRADIEANLEAAAQQEAQIEKLSEQLQALESSTSADREEADARLQAAQAQFIAAKMHAQNVFQRYASQRMVITEATSTAHRQLRELRGRVATTRGENWPPTLAQVEAAEQRMKDARRPLLLNPLDPPNPGPAQNGWSIARW